MQAIGETDIGKIYINKIAEVILREVMDFLNSLSILILLVFGKKLHK